MNTYRVYLDTDKGKCLGTVRGVNCPDALLRAWAKWPETHPNRCGNPAGAVVVRRIRPPAG